MCHIKRYAWALLLLISSNWILSGCAVSSSSLKLWRSPRIREEMNSSSQLRRISVGHAGTQPAAIPPKVPPAPEQPQRGHEPQSKGAPRVHTSVIDACQWNYQRPFRSSRTCLDSVLDYILGQRYGYWLYDYKLWFGFALYVSSIAYWYTTQFVQGFYDKAIYVIAMNLLVLHLLQYNPSSFVVLLIFYLALHNVIIKSVRSLFIINDVVEDGGFICQSLYEDLSAPFVQSVYCFVGQFGLMCLYMEALNNQVQGSVSYSYWLLAYFSLQMTAYFFRGADSFLGTEWRTILWISILRNNRKMTFETTPTRGVQSSYTASAVTHTVDLPANEIVKFKLSTTEVAARFFFGFFINATCRDIMAYTVPLLLSHFTDPLNFVVYCVGCNFITTLDDCTDKEFKVNLDDTRNLSRSETTKTESERRRSRTGV